MLIIREFNDFSVALGYQIVGFPFLVQFTASVRVPRNEKICFVGHEPRRRTRTKAKHSKFLSLNHLFIFLNSK